MAGEGDEVDVTDWPEIRPETMGKSAKSWLEELGGQGHQWLLKLPKRSTGRAASGDDWAEHLGSQIAHILGIRSHQTRLAFRRRGSEITQYGVICRDFTEGRRYSLSLGNEFLARDDNEYALEMGENIPSAYALHHVLTSLADPEEMPGDTIETFVSYLMLDALILNNDRNHTNWGVLKLTGGNKDETAGQYQLAPSFDHGSCLGWELNDRGRRRGIKVRGSKLWPSLYVERSFSKFSGLSEATLGPSRPTTFEVFVETARLYPEEALRCLGKLEQTPLEQITGVLQAVPDCRLSAVAKCYTAELLRETRRRLLLVLKYLRNAKKAAHSPPKGRIQERQ